MEDYFNLLPVKSTVGWWETSQPQLHSFTLETSTSPALSCAGRWKGVLWSVHDSCSLPLLLLHLSSAPRCAPLHGHQFPSGHIHLLQERSSIAVGGYLLPRDLHELLADRLLSHGLFQRLQGNVCSSSWRTFTPSFFNDLGVCRVVFTDSHSCPSQLQFFWRLFFSPLLKYISPEVFPTQLCPVVGGLEPAGAICVLHGHPSFSTQTLPATPTEVSTRASSLCTLSTFIFPK